jgi:hypothetical protein
MRSAAVTFEPDPSVHNDPETLRLCPDIAKKCPVCNPKPALAPAGGVVYQLGGVWGPDVKKSTSPAPEDLMLVPRSYEEKFGKIELLESVQRELHPERPRVSGRPPLDPLERPEQHERLVKARYDERYDELYGSALLRERDPQKLHDELDAARRKAEKK